MNLADSLNSSYKKRNTLHDDNLNNNNTSECVNVVKHTKEEDSLGSGNQRHVHHDGPYHHRQRVNKVNNGWPQRSNNSCSRPNMPPMNPFLNQLWKGRVDIENFDRCHRTVPQHYQRHQHQYYRNDQSSSSYSSLSSSSSLLSSWNQNMNSYHGRCNSQTNYGQKIPSTAMEGYDNTRIMQYSTSTLSNNNETSEKYGTNSIIIHNNINRTTRTNSHNKNINNKNYNRDNHRRQYSKLESKSNNNNKNNNNTRRKKDIRIYTSSNSFESFRKQNNNAKRYKVHKPNCKCSAIRDIKAHMIRSNSDLSSAPLKTTTTPTTPTTTTTLDGLVILPETKLISSVYLCDDTHHQSFEKNRKRFELKLRRELFGTEKNGSATITTTANNHNHNDHDTEADKNHQTSTASVSASSSSLSTSRDNKKGNDIKVSCASCLLECEPNGFVCISSPSLSTVRYACHQANLNASKKKIDMNNNNNDNNNNKNKNKNNGKLHSDHAQYLCALSKKNLSFLLKRKYNPNDKVELLKVLSEQGVPCDDDYEAKSGSITNNVPKNGNANGNANNNVDLIMGHHLKSLLIILLNDNDQMNRDTKYIMVMIYDDSKRGKRKFTLDLPGGKRYLGESSMEGATRELEEETSLIIDESTWKVKHIKYQKKVRENVYYIIAPPVDMDNLIQDPFWG